MEGTLASIETWWAELAKWPKSGIVLLSAILLAAIVRRFILKRLDHVVASTSNDFDDRLVQFIRTFFFVIVFFVTILVILRIHEVDFSPLLAGAGIAGIAIGLAAKETLADVLAGIFLITDRPLRIGDRVKIEHIGRDWGGWGDVVDVGLRRTLIRNTDGVVVNYPNNVLANSVITNFSHDENPVRVRVRFQVDYTADLGKARETAEAAIRKSRGVLEGTVQVVVRSVWDTTRGHLLAGVLMEGRYLIKDVRDRTRIRSGVLENVMSDLNAAGIPLPAARVQLGR